MTDLYAVVGVPRTASQEQIRAAYRARAKVLHPDAGGDGDEFAALARAYAVLSDLERREKYDLTGDETTGADLVERMVSLIAAMFSSCVQDATAKGISLTTVNYIDLIGNKIRENLVAIEEFQSRSAAQLVERQKLVGKITRDDGEPNLFVGVLETQIRDINAAVSKSRLDRATHEMALDEIFHYENEVEMIRWMHVMQNGGSQPFGNTSSAQFVQFTAI